MKTIRDIEDCYLMSEHKFNKGMDKFMADFYKPVFETWKAQLWREIPAEMKQTVQANKPAQFNRLEKRFENKE